MVLPFLLYIQGDFSLFAQAPTCTVHLPICALLWLNKSRGSRFAVRLLKQTCIPESFSIRLTFSHFMMKLLAFSIEAESKPRFRAVLLLTPLLPFLHIPNWEKLVSLLISSAGKLEFEVDLKLSRSTLLSMLFIHIT